ncbi:MAG: hypothetical protein QM296_13535 [Bacillota bacterium]|nr:hypothetical protein [Bacillota bacterium]
MPRNRGRNEKIVQGWPKKVVCALKPGHKPRFLAKGGQKLRWCPGIGAGTKNLSTAGQKRPFVPAKPDTNPDYRLSPSERIRKVPPRSVHQATAALAAQKEDILHRPVCKISTFRSF